MKRFTIFILSILFYLSASAQYDSTKKLQPVGAYGNANNNGSYAGLLRLPRHNNTMAVADSGAIAYKNGTIRVWNGTAWVEVVGSGGGSSVLTTAEAQWPARFDSVGVDSIRFKLAESFVDDTVLVAYDAAHTLVKRGDTLRMMFVNGDSTTVGVVASGGSGEISAGEGIRTYGNIVTWADTLTQSKNLYLLGGSYSQYTKWQSLYGGSFAGWETRTYKNDMSEYSFVNIQPSSISLQSFAGGKNNYLKVQGDITIHTQDSGLLKITAPLPAGASNDSVLVKGADNVVRLVPQQGANTLQGAFNGSIGTDPAIDGGGNPLVMNNLGYTEITATDDVNINSNATNTFSGRVIYINATDTLTLNSDTLRIRIGGASVGKVLTATDSYGTATWQTPASSADTIQVHTSGSTVTVGDSTTWLIINPSSALTSLTVNLPSTTKIGKILRISFGGTITAPATSVVNTLTIAPYAGSGVIGSTVFYSVETSDNLIFKYYPTLSKWYRQ